MKRFLLCLMCVLFLCSAAFAEPGSRWDVPAGQGDLVAYDSPGDHPLDIAIRGMARTDGGIDHPGTYVAGSSNVFIGGVWTATLSQPGAVVQQTEQWTHTFQLDAPGDCTMYLPAGAIVTLPEHCDLHPVNAIDHELFQEDGTLSIPYLRCLVGYEAPALDFFLSALPGQEARISLSVFSDDGVETEPVTVAIEPGRMYYLDFSYWGLEGRGGVPWPLLQDADTGEAINIGVDGSDWAMFEIVNCLVDIPQSNG